MDNSSIAFSPLLIIILLAAFVPVLINKIKWLSVPTVVGEVIAGMIIGKSGFNLIQGNQWLDFLYTFGFAFLMFLSGLEVDFNQIRSAKGIGSKWYKKPVFISIIIFAGTLLLAFIIAFGLKQAKLTVNVPLITLIFSTTSLGIVVPTLKEKNLLGTVYGQIILLSSLIADFTTMILVTIYVSLYSTAAVDDVYLILLLFLIFFIIYRMGLKLATFKVIKELTSTTSQIKVRVTFALILIFIALSQVLGTEVILGAFLAGLIVSLVEKRERSQLYLKLDAIGYGFFIPIFFIMVGVNFDIKAVINNPNALYLLPLLLVSVYAVKIIPALILKTGFTWKESIASGFLLSSRLSLIIATSAIGMKLNIISSSTNNAIILVAIITCTFSPMLFNKLSPSAKESLKQEIFIIGVKQRTLLLATELQSPNINITFITHNPQKYEKVVVKQNQKVYLGDPLDIDFLEEVQIRKANAVIISKNTTDISEKLCKICSEDLKLENVLLLNEGPDYLPDDNFYGAKIISSELATVFMVKSLISYPQATSLLYDSKQTGVGIKEIYVYNPQFFDIPVHALELPGDCLILSIIRGNDRIIPHGNNSIRKGDLLMVAGTLHDVEKAYLQLSYGQE